MSDFIFLNLTWMGLEICTGGKAHLPPTDVVVMPCPLYMPATIIATVLLRCALNTYKIKLINLLIMLFCHVHYWSCTSAKIIPTVLLSHCI